MPHIDAPSRDNDRTTTLAVVTALIVLFFLAGVYNGSEYTHDKVVEQCVTNERFYDGELRYFCTPWPADKANEEETYEEDQDLESSIQS